MVFSPPLRRGDARKLHISNLVDELGNPTTFGTLDVVRFTIKHHHFEDDLQAIVQKSSYLPFGGITLDIGQPTGTIALEPADTADLEGNTRIVWDLQLAVAGDPDDIVTLASGEDIIYDDVTVTAP